MMPSGTCAAVVTYKLNSLLSPKYYKAILHFCAFAKSDTSKVVSGGAGPWIGILWFIVTGPGVQTEIKVIN